jgi:hypothetical protein
MRCHSTPVDFRQFFLVDDAGADMSHSPLVAISILLSATVTLNEMRNHRKIYRHHHHQIHHSHASNASLDSPSPNLQEEGKECGSKASSLSVKTASTEGGGAPIHLTF